MKKITLFIVSLCFLTGCKNTTENVPAEDEQSQEINMPVNEQVAYAHGFEEFEKIKQINFTFNVRVNDTVRTSRAWKWFPQEDRVELTEKEQTISYINDGDFTEAEQAADQKFINDTYWLLFPFQLIWSDFNMEETETAEAPLSKKQMKRLSINFKEEGGYTPGDTYHVYFEDDNILKEWTYVSSNGRNLSTTWEDYENFEGIKIAKMHQSEDGSFQLFFTDIEVSK